MNTPVIHLTEQEAALIFGSPDDWDPVPILNYWCTKFDDENLEILDQELKLLLLVCKTYMRYQSKDVKYLVMGLVRRYLKVIYSNNKKTLPLENLKFLEIVIFRFRNFKNLSKFKKYFLDEEFLDKIRYGLFKNGVYPDYQGNLFN